MQAIMIIQGYSPLSALHDHLRFLFWQQNSDTSWPLTEGDVAMKLQCTSF